MHAHYPPRRPTQPPAAARKVDGARVRRLARVLAAVTCGLLAPAAFVPAAFAMTAPGSGAGGSTRYTNTVIIAGGMAGWQITLIALGAALLAAAGTLLLERVRAARRAAAATTA
jgi:hypothetical protein